MATRARGPQAYVAASYGEDDVTLEGMDRDAMVAEVHRQRRERALVLDQVADGFWDWHVEDDYEYMSPRFWAVFGYEPGEKRHHPSEWQALAHPEDLQAARDNLEKHIASRGQFPYDQRLRCRHRRGHWVTVRRRGRVVGWTSDGAPTRMVGSHTDLSELVAACSFAELISSEASLGVWDWPDVTVEAAYWSPRFHELLGYEVGELETSLNTFKVLIHPDDLAPTLSAVDAHLKAGSRYRQEFRLRCKSGEYRWFEGRGGAVRDADGNAIRMVGAIDDIHARKVAMVELARTNADLAYFAHVASHDLKSPLRAIGAALDWLEEDIAAGNLADVGQHIALMHERTLRLTDLVEGLLEYARVDGRAAPTRIPLSEIVREMQEDVVSPHPGFTLRVDGHLPDLFGNRAMLRQVVANLVENAIRHHDERQGTIVVSASEEGPNARVQLRDDGPGIDAAFRERVFKPFVTLTSSEDSGGAGIGLALVEKIVSMHGGTVAVLDGEGGGEPRGCTIAFTWPLAT